MPLLQQNNMIKAKNQARLNSTQQQGMKLQVTLFSIFFFSLQNERPARPALGLNC